MPYVLNAEFEHFGSAQDDTVREARIRFMTLDQVEEYQKTDGKVEYYGLYFVEDDDENFSHLKTLLCDARIAGCFDQVVEAVKLQTPDIWEQFDKTQPEAPEEEWTRETVFHRDLSQL